MFWYFLRATEEVLRHQNFFWNFCQDINILRGGGHSGAIYRVRPNLRSLPTLPCLNSLQKVSYTLQFFFTVIFKYFYLNVKRRALGTLGEILVLLIKKYLIIEIFLEFFWSSYSLQKLSYTLRFFFKVILLFLFLNFAHKNAGFWDTGGNSRHINKRNIFLEFLCRI